MPSAKTTPSPSPRKLRIPLAAVGEDLLVRDNPAAARRAVFSRCERYRYSLTIDSLDNPCCFVGLNPSTADEFVDDPTVRRCRNFARDWGYSGLVMLNAYGFRSTDPKGLLTIDDPVGSGNDDAMKEWFARCRRILLAWGKHADPVRTARIHELLAPHRSKCFALVKNKDGSPKHPLYVAANTPPAPYF